MIILAVMILARVSCLNAKAEMSYFEIPGDIREEAEQIQDETQLSEYIILSIVYQESRFDVEYVNGNVTQVTKLKWFREGIDALGITEPKTDYRQNMRLCSYYLVKWFEEHPDNPYLVMRLWNEGTDALSNPEYISRYSKEVIDRADRWTIEDECEETTSRHCRNPENLG